MTGPAEEGLWEPGLLLNGDIDVISASQEKAAEFQEKRYKRLHQVTSVAVTRVEAILGN